jgi:hypothetical protein
MFERDGFSEFFGMEYDGYPQAYYRKLMKPRRRK